MQIVVFTYRQAKGVKSIWCRVFNKGSNFKIIKKNKIPLKVKFVEFINESRNLKISLIKPFFTRIPYKL